MQNDPAMEWRRLAEEYRAKSEEELRELAADFSDLTETAQQALRQEMRSRGLGDPEPASEMVSKEDAGPGAWNASAPEPRATRANSGIERIETDSLPGVIGQAPKIVRDEAWGDQNAGEQSEYTWKTFLCECETSEQAQGLSSALQQAGLDNWVQWPREFGRRYARILVAADQLDRAREIASQPIAEEKVSESTEEIPEFVEPKCPTCGSDDVVLEGVDAQNHWRCEACDNAWSDDAEPGDAKPSTDGEKAT